MRDTLIIPVVGKVYELRGGGSYLCLSNTYSVGTARLVRITDGWTLVAHNVYQQPDGLIHWDYSTGGHWNDNFVYEPKSETLIV